MKKLKLSRSLGFRWYPGVAIGIKTSNHDAKEAEVWTKDDDKDREIVLYTVAHSFLLPFMEFAILDTYVQYATDEELEAFMDAIMEEE